MQFPDGLVKSYQDGRERFYLTRVIINLSRWKYDIFHKTYLLKNEELTTDIPCEESDFEIRKMEEKKEADLIDRISNIEEKTGTCYYRLIIAAVQRHGSIREVSRQTGVPRNSIHNAMKKIRKIIKDD